MAVVGAHWLVADSEDEDGLAELLPGNRSGSTDHLTTVGDATFSDISVIQTAAFSSAQLHTPQRDPRPIATSADEPLFTPPSGGKDSTIGNFTSIPSPSNSPPIRVTRPRPRPRVVIKKATTRASADIATTSFSHISDPVSTVRQTNDSIHPAASTSSGTYGIVDDAYSSFDIAERAKMRSRKKAEVSKKIMSLSEATNEVIELTSDEDELVLKSTKRQKKQETRKPKVSARPRPKPRVRATPMALKPNGSQSSGTAIRDPQVSPTRHTSQLPPSTLPTIPPSTPPQPPDLSLLSSPLVTTRKRKRIRPSVVDDDDETDIIGRNPTGGPASLKEPPPFFAPSSSSLPTDSGVEIAPVESFNGQGKKHVSSSRKETQTRTQNRGRRGKKVEMASTVVEQVKEPAAIIQESSTAVCGGPSDLPSPAVRNSTATKKTPIKQSITEKGKARAIDPCDEDVEPSETDTSCMPPVHKGEGQKIKENLRPDELSFPKRDPLERTSAPSRPKSTTMSELIRRVNSQPSSPFPNATKTYSPFLKSSRTMLAKIAPLHPNRRTPPPPPPRPPPSKKSKKQIEMEERIEEELSETVDGWSCLTDEERRALRKARTDAELGYE